MKAKIILKLFLCVVDLAENGITLNVEILVFWWNMFVKVADDAMKFSSHQCALDINNQ